MLSKGGKKNKNKKNRTKKLVKMSSQDITLDPVSVHSNIFTISDMPTLNI